MKTKKPKKEKHEKEDKRWLSLPRLEGVRWLYANDWWDWVLSGVVEYYGKRYFAFCKEENHDKKYNWFRRYLMVDLTKEDWHKDMANLIKLLKKHKL